MDVAICYKVVQRVLTSWELASQNYSSREEIGLQVLLCMFRTEPETKTVFGFTPKQNVEGNPMLKMGAMIHGTRIYSMLDQALSLVGPDMETLVEFLETLGERHSRLGVKRKYFTYLSDGVREVLATTLGDKYTSDDDAAWKELLEFLAVTITKNMT
jgi:hemoglobin-like flavoprotein